MIFITSAVYYDEGNNFRVKEIYVTDTKVTYALRRDEGFVPQEYELNILDAQKPLFGINKFGPVRKYNDDDPKTLAMYFYENLSHTSMRDPAADSTLFDILSNFGEPA